MKSLAYPIVILILLSSCVSRPDKEKLKLEVFSTEKAFEKMAADKGIAEAFYFFADENAVINRGKDSLISGREGIRNFYEKQNFSNVRVNWTPDFVEVSESGDLAYTYGKYLWEMNSPGKESVQFKGIFHTVWKRQKDGTWKFVWD